MNYVLYNVAHAHTKIQSPDQEAWIRVLGFFPGKEIAINYALKHFPSEEVRIAPIEEFRMLMRTSADKQREVAKHGLILNIHDTLRKEAFEQTLQNAKDHKMGDLIFNVSDQRKMLIEEFGIEEESEKYFAIVDTSAKEVRLQKFCVMAFVPDYETIALSEKQISNWKVHANSAFETYTNENSETNIEHEIKVEETEVSKLAREYIHKKEVKEWLHQNPLPKILKQCEPGIKFLSVHDTEADAKRWILDFSELPQNKHYDIACVAMYEWIRVMDVWNDKQKRNYREPQLAKLYENKEYNRLEALKLEGKVKEIEIIA